MSTFTQNVNVTYFLKRTPAMLTFSLTNTLHSVFSTLSTGLFQKEIERD